MMSFYSAALGSFVADALAMPGHWYYDRQALKEDYGSLDEYKAPRSPHPDSILSRSEYHPLNSEGEILHDQAEYWGQSGIHYHQFLKAGENTLNLQLAQLLMRQIQATKQYDAGLWLDVYIQFMRTPGNHRDTYLEECHRGFFTNYAKGKNKRKCGTRDEHIGGLASVPALLAALPAEANWRAIVREHVVLTHRHSNVIRAADCLARLLHALANGISLREAIAKAAGDWFSTRKAQGWSIRPDKVVIGRILSPACYINHSFPAALYLAWKYHDDFEAGIVANAMVGGDNCHRGVVVGALLGFANKIKPHWQKGLTSQQLKGLTGLTFPEGEPSSPSR